MVTGRFSTLSSSAMPGSLSTSIWELIGIEIRLRDQNLEWVRNLPWAWGIYHGVQSSNRQFWSLVPYMTHTQEPNERRRVAVHQQIRDVPSNRSTIRMLRKFLQFSSSKHYKPQQWTFRTAYRSRRSQKPANEIFQRSQLISVSAITNKYHINWISSFSSSNFNHINSCIRLGANLKWISNWRYLMIFFYSGHLY